MTDNAFARMEFRAAMESALRREDGDKAREQERRERQLAAATSRPMFSSLAHSVYEKRRAAVSAEMPLSADAEETMDQLAARVYQQRRRRTAVVAD
jgi:hypothetical protein